MLCGGNRSVSGFWKQTGPWTNMVSRRMPFSTSCPNTDQLSYLCPTSVHWESESAFPAPHLVPVLRSVKSWVSKWIINRIYYGHLRPGLAQYLLDPLLPGIRHPEELSFLKAPEEREKKKKKEKDPVTQEIFDLTSFQPSNGNQITFHLCTTCQFLIMPTYCTSTDHF